jgi:hypothetical protein
MLLGRKGYKLETGDFTTRLIFELDLSGRDGMGSNGDRCWKSQK